MEVRCRFCEALLSGRPELQGWRVVRNCLNCGRGIETWKLDLLWSQGHWYEIERILKLVAPNIVSVEQASEEDDQQHATDYVVTVSSGRIAVRVRKAWETPFSDLTLRSYRRSGAETELEKLRKGYARWYLYAWANTQALFERWVFVDIQRMYTAGLPDFYYSHEKENNDGATKFVPIPVPSLEEYGCVVAKAGLFHNVAIR